MTALLKVQVVTDASQAVAGLDQVEKKTSNLSKGMKAAAIPAAAAGAALVKVALDAKESASNLQQSTGAVESVFADQAAAVQGYAAAAQDSVGLAKTQYQELAAVTASQLKNMGVSTDQLVGQTDDLITKGADLAATFGGTTADAVGALGALLRGEADPIERYGVSIKDADVKARMAAMGLDGLEGEAAKTARTTALLALINEQTAAATGQFSRESDQAAGAQQRAAAAAENAAAALGESLLPIQTEVSNAMASAATVISENVGLFTTLAVIIGVVAAVVLGYNAIMAVVPVVQGIATAAQWAWNAALLANPVTWVVLGIIALIAIIVVLVTHWDTVKQVAIDCWNALVQAAQDAWTWLGGVFDNIKAAGAEFLAPAIGAIESLMGIARRASDIVGGLLAGARNIGKSLPGIGGFFANDHGDDDPAAGFGFQFPRTPPPGTFAADAWSPGVRSFGSSSTMDRTQDVNVHITFTGLVTDKVGVGREIVDALRELGTVTGRPVIVS